MNKIKIHYIQGIIGFLLLITGLILVKVVTEPQGFMLGLPYICIGIGCGTFSYGLGSVINTKTLQNNPVLRKQQEIAQNDERNIAINNSAKAKAYDLMVLILGVLILTYAFLGVDLIATLLLIFVYLFITFYGLFCRIKYEKQM